jgi:hypothetical protein
MVFASLASKLGVTVSCGLASKPTATVFTGLVSKPVATVFTGLASKPVATVFSSLASKLVVTVSPGLASKPVVSFLVEPQNQGGGGFPGLGLKTGSSGLVIWASKSHMGEGEKKYRSEDKKKKKFQKMMSRACAALSDLDFSNNNSSCSEEDERPKRKMGDFTGLCLMGKSSRHISDSDSDISDDSSLRVFLCESSNLKMLFATKTGCLVRFFARTKS